ncbi:TUP1-like enhancer of split domain-containing protein [Phthorimaea operculella]|nr:TUP1-like enhancer of split domain-containing protein [Phthorimaea operculella]
MTSPGAPIRPMDRQIETRTSDGKRRITPVFIPLTHADAKPMDRQIETRTSDGKRRITPVFIPLTHADAKPMDRQIETRTSDGKRRITPVFIPLTHADANESLHSQPGATENCFSTSSASKSRIVVERRDDIVIHPNVSNHAITNLSAKPIENGLDARLRKRGPAPLPGTVGPVVRAAGLLRLQVVNKACSTHYGPLSKIQLIPNNSASNDPVWETYLGSAVSCIACDARWACVSCADGTLHAWRLARSHATRALPPIVLMSPACKLALTGDTLVAVTTGAELAMWDLSTATNIIQPLCFRSLLQHGVTVTNCTLLYDGNPLISLSNDKSYIYSKKLCTWVVWADVSDPVWRSCRGMSVTRAPRAPHASTQAALYPHAKSKQNTASYNTKVVLVDVSDPVWRSCRGMSVTRAPRAPHASTQAALYPHAKSKQNTASYNTNQYSAAAARAWLEAQVASCLHLKLAKDYKHWMTSLFTHHCKYGTEEQLRTILDDMLGPSHCTSVSKHWQSTILDIKKHEILEKLLEILVRELRWQRLYTEYNDQLQDIKNMTQAHEKKNTTMETTINGH